MKTAKKLKKQDQEHAKRMLKIRKQMEQIQSHPLSQVRENPLNQLVRSTFLVRR